MQPAEKFGKHKTRVQMSMYVKKFDYLSLGAWLPCTYADVVYRPSTISILGLSGIKRLKVPLEKIF